jgi:amino acid permease
MDEHRNEQIPLEQNGGDTSEEIPDNEMNSSRATTIRRCLYNKRWIILIVAIVVISNVATGFTTYYLKVFPID